MHNFRELKIWQRSMNLVVKVYELSAKFPKEETYGLAQQLKRCACSVPSNISEGSGRNSNVQFRYFLEISMGSCNELQTQVELSKRLGYCTDNEIKEILDEANEVFKMIYGFYNSLNPK
jgi:four helix bundle protein